MVGVRASASRAPWAAASTTAPASAAPSWTRVAAESAAALATVRMVPSTGRATAS